MIIEKTRFGIASRVGDTIYVNRIIADSYPLLYQALIKHESRHSGRLSIRDILLDIGNSELKDIKKEYYKFVLTNPSSWSEFSPIWINNGNIQINITLAIFYTLVMLLGGIILVFL